MTNVTNESLNSVVVNYDSQTILIIDSVYIAPVRKCRQMLFMLHNDVSSAVPFRGMHQMVAELPSLLAFYFIMYFLQVDQDDDVKLSSRSW
jgi:hypothetical protein